MNQMDFISHIKEGINTFIIAEIGQNHQGDIEIAKKLIQIAQECGVDCVKFQKTCLKEKFTKSALDAPYLGANSWGQTYGEHKAHLEFSNEQFLELQQYAKDIGILFTASAMDEKALECLVNLKVPFIKIGSGDSNNLIMIEKAAKTGVPLVISTGMIDLQATQNIYKLVSKYHKNFALLHCVSAYPTPYDNINLKVLCDYQKRFADIIIGYSGHELGTHVTVAAVAMGAKIVERHITLNKKQKGSDHNCSLEPAELKLLVNQIRSLEKAMGHPIKQVQPSEKPCYDKLGKSLVYAKNLKSNHALEITDFKIKVSVPKGIDAAKFEQVLGKQLKNAVEVEQPVLHEHFY